MKKTEFQDTKSKRLFGGKGFYVALAVSLAAVGGAAWFGVNSAMERLNAPTPTPENTQNSVSTPDTEWSLPDNYVNAPKEDVPAAPDAKDPPDTKDAAAKAPDTAVEQGFILPLKGDILNAYSGDKVVKSKTLDDWVMHTGVDISSAVSTPVKAVSAGKVTAIENDSLWGTTVTIEHPNGISSYYANLKSAVNVKMNQAVKLGDVIGAVGETCDIERAEGSHLHFGVKKNDNWVDPFSVVK